MSICLLLLSSLSLFDTFTGYLLSVVNLSYLVLGVLMFYLFVNSLVLLRLYLVKAGLWLIS